MTTDRLELLLAFGIVAVYLLDAMRFLRPREALVERLGDGRWRLLFGAVRFELAGRRPALPNPLRPDRALWLADWRPADAPAGPDAIRSLPIPASATALGWTCLSALVVVVFAAPAALVAGQGLWFAGAIGTGYIVALVGGTVLVVRASVFGLRRWPAAGIAAIGVICLPCAPNLLRAACGSRTLSIELPAFAEASAGGGAGFRRRFAGVLRNELAAAGDDPRQEAVLRAVLTRVEAQA
jgi:hypothetical protein